MQLSRQALLYYTLGITCIALKFGYAGSTTTDLLWLLRPTDALIGSILSSPSTFDPSRGFVHTDLHISVDKSCSGFNFWVLCSALLCVKCLQYWGPKRAGAGWALLALAVLGYGLTVVVNTSRILTAVALQRLLPEAAQRLTWLHQAEGVVVYLIFLFLIYTGFTLLCHYLILRNAKSA
ncbi:exosortase K [Hymenobacter mucosus]|uniref:Exosortase K n=1 Tax=Hymenobacter mucosus TaxID=1411120 RepID=A0A238ZNA5_9BACT|nr:exosortase K [Hymenobacter mucosus]SNR84143.1 exosortase K [Hymenobacter mucosus]